MSAAAPSPPSTWLLPASARLGWALLLTIMALLLVGAWVFTGYQLAVYVQFVTLGTLVVSFQLITGLAGEFSLAQGTFFGLGAYTSTALLLHYHLTPWIGLFIGAIVAGTIALAFGLLIFGHGLRFLYFAIASLGLAQAANVAANHFEWTGAGLGMLVPLASAPGLMQFSDKRWHAFIGAALFGLAMIVCTLYGRSAIGTQLRVMRRDEDLSEALGMRAVPMKTLSLVIAAMLAASAGTMYAQYVLSVTPDSMFSIERDLEVTLAALLGGLSVTVGPVLGLATVVIATQAVTQVAPGIANLDLVAYGIMILAVALLLPDGLAARLRPFVEIWRPIPSTLYAQIHEPSVSRRPLGAERPGQAERGTGRLP